MNLFNAVHENDFNPVYEQYKVTQVELFDTRTWWLKLELWNETHFPFGIIVQEDTEWIIAKAI